MWAHWASVAFLSYFRNKWDLISGHAWDIETFVTSGHAWDIETFVTSGHSWDIETLVTSGLAWDIETFVTSGHAWDYEISVTSCRYTRCCETVPSVFRFRQYVFVVWCLDTGVTILCSDVQPWVKQELTTPC
jgi:hypothetical protein